MKNKKERGSMTVETTICLTLFILFFVVMLNFINMAFVQMRIQHALANTSYEMSVYSYMGTKASEWGTTANCEKYMFTLMDKEHMNDQITIYPKDQYLREKLYKLGENPSMSQPIIKDIMERYLTQHINGQTYLNNSGIVGGKDGLHYELSEYNQDEGYIRVSVYYKYRIIGLPFLNAGIDVNIFQNATCKLWR